MVALLIRTAIGFTGTSRSRKHVRNVRLRFCWRRPRRSRERFATAPTKIAVTVPTKAATSRLKRRRKPNQPKRRNSQPGVFMLKSGGEGAPPAAQSITGSQGGETDSAGRGG